MVSLDAATEAIELGECYGLTLDPDQQATLYAALAERADGSWAATSVGDFKGRQAGKNDTLKVRVLSGVELFGERLVLHTAHEFPTANEDFLRFVAVLEAYDDLRSKVARVRYANGEQGVEWLNGARLKYRARTGGSGRGFSEADLVVYDEAQHLKAEHLAASLPTLLANPNFQAWFCGSGGFEHSTMAWSLRRRAVLAEPGDRLAYTENTAQHVTVVDGRIQLASPPAEDMLTEEALLTHPGYRTGRVPYETFESMFRSMGPDLFGREFLNIWEPEPGIDDGVLPGWAALAESGSTIASHRQWAVALSEDMRTATIGIAGRRADGKFHVEWMERRVDPDAASWAVDKVVEIHGRVGVPIRIANGTKEAGLAPLLRERGVDVVEVSTADAARATVQLIAAVQSGQLRHLGQAALDMAVRGAGVRKFTDGAVVWSQRNSQVEITPLIACTVALGGVPATETRRVPSVY